MGGVNGERSDPLTPPNRHPSPLVTPPRSPHLDVACAGAHPVRASRVPLPLYTDCRRPLQFLDYSKHPAELWAAFMALLASSMGSSWIVQKALGYKWRRKNTK